MKKTRCLILAILALALAAGACQKKREISIDKVSNIIQQSVIAEQADSGHRLVVDTIMLNPATDAVYKGELHGCLGARGRGGAYVALDDSITVTYDLTVTEEGDEYSMEWDLAN